MNIAFLTETTYTGKWPIDFPNARTEIAWQIALDATHFNIYSYEEVKGFDHVFIIFPKGTTNLSLDASQIRNISNKDESIFSSNITNVLKQNNKKICFVQEGPSWFFNDFSIVDQFNYYNHVQNCDIIFAHNNSDIKWYRGLFPGKQIEVLPSLMIDVLIKNILRNPNPQSKVMIGGNFSKWYGGFQSYIIADEFTDHEKWTIESHSKRPQEDQIPDLKHLPRLSWNEWMQQLSTFKYGVHLMPTVAAGTFSLNCAYFGIPCIGNIKMDTQVTCFPGLSVDAEDIVTARFLANRLNTDKDFYNYSSLEARKNYEKNFTLDVFLDKMKRILV